MNSYFLIVLVLSLILPIGVGMLLAARWSRKNNLALKMKNEDSQELALRALINVIKNGFNWHELKVAAVNYYSSSLSKPEAFIGYALAIGVILYFCFFCFAGRIFCICPHITKRSG